MRAIFGESNMIHPFEYMMGSHGAMIMVPGMAITSRQQIASAPVESRQSLYEIWDELEATRQSLLRIAERKGRPVLRVCP